MGGPLDIAAEARTHRKMSDLYGQDVADYQMGLSYATYVLEHLMNIKVAFVDYESKNGQLAIGDHTWEGMYNNRKPPLPDSSREAAIEAGRRALRGEHVAFCCDEFDSPKLSMNYLYKDPSTGKVRCLIAYFDKSGPDAAMQRSTIERIMGEIPPPGGVPVSHRIGNQEAGRLMSQLTSGQINSLDEYSARLDSAARQVAAAVKQVGVEAFLAQNLHQAPRLCQEVIPTAIAPQAPEYFMPDEMKLTVSMRQILREEGLGEILRPWTVDSPKSAEAQAQPTSEVIAVPKTEMVMVSLREAPPLVAPSSPLEVRGSSEKQAPDSVSADSASVAQQPSEGMGTVTQNEEKKLAEAARAATAHLSEATVAATVANFQRQNEEHSPGGAAAELRSSTSRRGGDSEPPAAVENPRREGQARLTAPASDAPPYTSTAWDTSMGQGKLRVEQVPVALEQRNLERLIGSTKESLPKTERALNQKELIIDRRSRSQALAPWTRAEMSRIEQWNQANPLVVRAVSDSSPARVSANRERQLRLNAELELTRMRGRRVERSAVSAALSSEIQSIRRLISVLRRPDGVRLQEAGRRHDALSLHEQRIQLERLVRFPLPGAYVRELMRTQAIELFRKLGREMLTRFERIDNRVHVTLSSLKQVRLALRVPAEQLVERVVARMNPQQVQALLRGLERRMLRNLLVLVRADEAFRRSREGQLLLARTACQLLMYRRVLMLLGRTKDAHRLTSMIVGLLEEIFQSGLSARLLQELSLDEADWLIALAEGRRQRTKRETAFDRMYRLMKKKKAARTFRAAPEMAPRGRKSRSPAPEVLRAKKSHASVMQVSTAEGPLNYLVTEQSRETGDLPPGEESETVPS